MLLFTIIFTNITELSATERTENKEKRIAKITEDGLYINTIKDNSLLYSPFNGYFKYMNGTYYLYNKNKTIVIKLKGLSKYKKHIKVEPKELIGTIDKEKFRIKVIIHSKEQDPKTDYWFLYLLLNNKKPNFELQYNNKTFLDKIKKHSYFDTDYYNFFLGLSKNAKKSLISERELLSYKLTLNDKFINIATKYNNGSIHLNNKEKIEYKKYLRFTKCLYTKPEFSCKINYPNEYIYYNKLIKETYGHFYIPEHLAFYKDVLKKAGLNKENPYYIPEWKIKYYVKNNVSKDMFLILNSINRQECPLESGACLSAGDAGPFQINFIHKQDYKYSKNLVYRIKNETNLTEKQRLIEELFDFQLKWTINRFNRLENGGHCKNLTGVPLTKCLAVLHNGNTRRSCYRYGRYVEFMYCYADSVAWIKNQYKKTYQL